MEDEAQGCGGIVVVVREGLGSCSSVQWSRPQMSLLPRLNKYQVEIRAGEDASCYAPMMGRRLGQVDAWLR